MPGVVGRDAYLTEIILALRDQLSSEGARAAGTLDRLDKQTDQLSAGFEAANRHSTTFGTSLRTLGINALALNEIRHLIYALISPLQRVAERSDQWKEMAARIQLVEGSAGDAAVTMNELVRIAKESRTPLSSVSTLYARLAQGLSDQNVGQAEFLDIVQAVSDAMLIYGASAAEADGAIIQFSQAMASGALRGEEFNSVSEQAPLLLDALAQSLGVAKGELRAMAKDGKLTTDVLREAIGGMSGQWRQAAETIPLTIGRAMTNLNTAMVEYAGRSEFVQDATAAIASGIEGLAENIGDAGEAVTDFVGPLALGAMAAAFYRGSQAISGYVQRQKEGIQQTVAATNAERFRAVEAKKAALADMQAAQARVAALQQQTLAELSWYRAQVRANGMTRETMAAGQALAVTRGALNKETIALTAAESAYAKAQAGVVAANAAVAASGTVAAVALGKLKAALTTIGWGAALVGAGYVIEAWLEIAENVKAATEELEKHAEVSDSIAKKQSELANKVTSTIAAFKGYADAATLADEQVRAAMSGGSEEVADYLDVLQKAADYWQAIEIQARQAGEAEQARVASVNLAKYTEALQRQTAIYDELKNVIFGINPAALELSKKFDELTGKTNKLGEQTTSTEQAIASLLGTLSFDSTAEAVVNVQTVADTLDVLSTASEQTGDKIRATREEIQEGLGKALDDLSSGALLNFTQQWDVLIRNLEIAPIAAVADVFDVVLRQALGRLKLDLDEVRTGVTAAGRDLRDTLETVAIAAQGDADVIGRAWDAVIAKLSDVEDIELVRETINRLGAEGRISFGQLQEAVEDLDRAEEKLKATTGDVAEAFKLLGVNSQYELRLLAEEGQRAFELIRDSGVATAQDIEAAFLAYAKKAIESGDAMQIALSQQEAQAMGLSEQYGEMAEKMADTRTETERVTDALIVQGQTLEQIVELRRQEMAAAIGTKDAVEAAYKLRVAEAELAGKVKRSSEPADIDFEDLFAKFGGDIGRLKTSSPGATPQMLKAYQEFAAEKQAAGFYGGGGYIGERRTLTLNVIRDGQVEPATDADDALLRELERTSFSGGRA